MSVNTIKKYFILCGVVLVLLFSADYSSARTDFSVSDSQLSFEDTKRPKGKPKKKKVRRRHHVVKVVEPQKPVQEEVIDAFSDSLAADALALGIGFTDAG